MTACAVVLGPGACCNILEASSPRSALQVGEAKLLEPEIEAIYKWGGSKWVASKALPEGSSFLLYCIILCNTILDHIVLYTTIYYDILLYTI